MLLTISIYAAVLLGLALVCSLLEKVKKVFLLGKVYAIFLLLLLIVARPLNLRGLETAEAISDAESIRKLLLTTDGDQPQVIAADTS